MIIVTERFSLGNELAICRLLELGDTRKDPPPRRHSTLAEPLHSAQVKMLEKLFEFRCLSEFRSCVKVEVAVLGSPS